MNHSINSDKKQLMLHSPSNDMSNLVFRLIFCLIVPFLVFVVQVFFKIDLPSKPSKINSEGRAKPSKQRAWTKDQTEKTIRFLVPTLTLVFIACYSVLAVGHYTNP